MPTEESMAARTLREERRKTSRAEAVAIMTLAGFEVRHVWELANGYWPDHPDYDSVRVPWWLFLTDIGPVQIGWRKRVLHIDWSTCGFTGIVTEDQVTKTDHYIHAWSVEKAVEYLRMLRTLALKARGPSTPAR